MEIFAKITAVFFIAIGLVAVAAGLVVVGGGLLQATRPVMPGMSLGNVSAVANGVVGFALLFQGFLILAVGQVLWLLADMAAALRSRRA